MRAWLHPIYISFLLFLISSSVLFAQTDTSEGSVDADSIFDLGVQLARDGEYRQAFREFEKAKNIYASKGANSSDIAKIYTYIGHLERRRGNHDEALSNYEKAKNILFIDKENNAKGIISLYMGMDGSYRALRDFDRSLTYSFEALRLCQEVYGADNYRVGYLYNNIGNTHDDRGDFDSATEYYGLSKDILEKKYSNKAKTLSNIYTNYGEALAKSERYAEAQEYYEKAIDLQGTNTRSTHLILALIHLGELFAMQGIHEKAIPYFERAISVSGLGSLSSEDFSNVNSPADCIRAMAGLGKTCNVLYENTDENQYHEKSRKVLSTANEFIEYLKADFKETGAREVLMRNSYPIYEQAIAAALNSRKGAKENLKEAFTFSEKSRNNLLREAVQEAEAKKFAGIPDSLLAEEKRIKIAISEEEKKRFDATNDNADIAKIDDLEENILLLKNEYAQILDTFEQKYPDYFDLKYAVSTVSIEEIRDNILQRDQAMVEYFVGDDMIFAFVISKEEFQVFGIDKNFDLADTVRTMRQSIFKWRPKGEKADAHLETYQRTATFLYDRLVAPFEHILPEKLIIVPGGVLGYLPFEALLEESPQSGDGFAQYAYLINNKQISYAYSATLLKEMLKDRNTGREVLGFAPSFGVSRDSLPDNLPYLKALKHNESEVKAINELLGGRIFTGSDATLQNFLEIAPLYKILHLATHGKANDKADEYSYLAFSYLIDDLDNELLYAGNLYNTQLRADMVVLSACETGIGELQEGEGILSLARGFSYAGTKSIVTTLWSIDDRASLEIMVDFYKNLEDGNRKDYALRQAKLDFIEDNNRRAHPLFWAGYIPIGNMETIAIGREVAWYAYVLWAVLALLVLFFVYRFLAKK